jgi:hypothetical protein
MIAPQAWWRLDHSDLPKEVLPKAGTLLYRDLEIKKPR